MPHTTTSPATPAAIHHDWTRAEVAALFDLPFHDLLFRAQSVHRQFHDPHAMQVSTLCSIKTGGCPEDCAYCPQSAHFDTPVSAAKRLDVATVLAEAQAARDAGATRFCMGAAWRNPKERDIAAVAEMIAGVRALGMESCATLGMLTAAQAQRLKDAGLDYYNHNLDTSPEYYPEIITTRTYQDRLETLEHVRAAGMHVCCGGIVGMGESRADRAGLLQTLATLPRHPESVPINLLVQVDGTPLHAQFQGTDALDPLEFVRTVAVARILMPAAMVRLSAGREAMDDALQALCFHAGANSVFYGEKLLTTGNPAAARDRALLERLGMRMAGAPTVAAQTAPTPAPIMAPDAIALPA